jgi:hypothetical protein
LKSAIIYAYLTSQPNYLSRKPYDENRGDKLYLPLRFSYRLCVENLHRISAFGPQKREKRESQVLKTTAPLLQLRHLRVIYFHRRCMREFCPGPKAVGAWKSSNSVCNG